VVITGAASYVQLQCIQYCSGKKIVYYDNSLEIENLPYAPLVREFEKIADEFWVSSQIAASSSNADDILIVGNPDFDQYFALAGQKPSCRWITFFGVYDGDYAAVL